MIEHVGRNDCVECAIGERQLLDRRARTRSELAEALRKRGVPEEAATAVLDRFAGVGLVDDAALASTYAAAQHRERGLAGRAVAAKLRQRGVGEREVQAAVEQIDRDSEYAAARSLAVKKLRSLDGVEPAAQARRLVGFLGRRGYSPGLAVERRTMRPSGTLPKVATDTMIGPGERTVSPPNSGHL